MIVETVSRDNIRRCSNNLNPSTENKRWSVIGRSDDGEYLRVIIYLKPGDRYFIRKSDYTQRVLDRWPLYSDSPTLSSAASKDRMLDTLYYLYRTKGLRIFASQDVQKRIESTYIGLLVSKKYLLRVSGEGKDWEKIGQFKLTNTAVEYLKRFGCV